MSTRRKIFSMSPVDLSFVDKAPDGIHAEATLRGSPEQIFAILADVTTWPRWFDGSKDMRWLSTSTSGIGAVRRATLVVGSFDERMIAWEPGQRFAFSIDASTLPLAKRALEDWRLTSVNGGSETHVSWSLFVEPRFAARLFRPLLVIAFSRMFRKSAERMNLMLQTLAMGDVSPVASLPTPART